MLKTIFLDLKKMIRDKKIWLSVMILAISACYICILFYYSGYVTTYRSQIRDDERMREIRITFNEEMSSEEAFKAIENVKENKYFDYIEFYDEFGYVNSKASFDVRGTLSEELGVIGVFNIYEGRDKPPYIYNVTSGKDIDLNSSNESIIVESVAYNSLESNEEIYINDKKYNISGICDEDDYMGSGIVSLKTFIDNGIRVKGVILGFREKPAEILVNDVQDKISNLDSNSVISVPKNIEWSIVNKLLSGMVRPIMLVIFTFLSVGLLLLGWFISNEHKYRVLNICGIKKHQLFGVIFGEVFILNLLAFVASSILFYIIIIKINVFNNDYSIYWYDFIFTFIFISLMCLMVSIYTYINIRRKTINDIKL